MCFVKEIPCSPTHIFFIHYHRLFAHHFPVLCLHSVPDPRLLPYPPHSTSPSSMSSAPSRKRAEPAVQANPLPGQDNASSQQHRETQDPRCLTESDHQDHKSSVELSSELYASLPDRSRNSTVDGSLAYNQDFLHQVPLPNRSLQAQASLSPTPSSLHPVTMSPDWKYFSSWCCCESCRWISTVDVCTSYPWGQWQRNHLSV